MKTTLLCVLLFILQLRYFKHPFSQVISKNYGQQTLKKFRKLKKLQLQRDKSQCDLEFLLTCKSCGVFPKFIYFRSSIRNFSSSKLYVSILHRCLSYEIRSKQKKFARLNKTYTSLLEQYKSVVSWLDYKVSLSRLTKDNINKINNVKRVHAKKLAALGVSHTGSINANKVIFNFSNRVLTNEEKEILKLGFQFGVPERKVSFVEHFLQFEKFLQQLNKYKGSNDNFEELSNKTKFLAQEGYRYKSQKHNDYNLNLKVLDDLKKDNNVHVTKPDKGKGIVLLNKLDYLNKTKEILDDNTKFVKLNGDWFKTVLKLEDKLNRFLRSIKNNLPESCFNFLFASGSIPGILYGLPKIHKPNCPIRPILSAIGTFNYNLAKFLVPILNPLTFNDYTVKNSIEFAKEIGTLNLTEPFFLASFDVKSLFTNIPLDETIEICVEESDRLNLIPYGLTKKQFRQLLQLAVKESIFVFDNQLYQQKDGVAMGSPLGPTLANLFLCFHESAWLSDCPSDFKPIKYNRYVDDCFLVFKSKEQADKFLDYLNSKHKNISFTSEYEHNNQLPFLDILIDRTDGILTTDVYRKDTYTGLGLNYFSYVPELFKINSMKTLIHRAYNICSNWHIFHNELERLRNYFHINGYPKHLVEKHINKFISGKFNSSNRKENNEKEIKYITLPYKGQFSYQLRNTMSTLLRKTIPDVTFRFIFVNRNTIGSLFNTKDSLPALLCSRVVYKYQCTDCMSSYIGSTCRNLKIRISEHKGVSYRTNMQITKPSFSRIRDHALQCKHPINEQGFTIKYRAKNSSDLRIAESLSIMKERPELNGTELATRLFIIS